MNIADEKFNLANLGPAYTPLKEIICNRGMGRRPDQFIHPILRFPSSTFSKLVFGTQAIIVKTSTLRKR